MPYPPSGFEPLGGLLRIPRSPTSVRAPGFCITIPVSDFSSESGFLFSLHSSLLNYSPYSPSPPTPSYPRSIVPSSYRSIVPSFYRLPNLKHLQTLNSSLPTHPLNSSSTLNLKHLQTLNSSSSSYRH